MKSISLFIAMIFCMVTARAQQAPSLSAMANSKESKGESPLFTINISPKNQALGSILISPTANILLADAQQWISSQLQLRAGVDELRKKNIPAAYPQMSVERFGQYYKNIKVEHGSINAAGKADKLELIQMEFYAVPDQFATTPVLSSDAALQNAMRYLGARKYVWEGYTGDNPLMQKPIGELVIVKDFFSSNDRLSLAYKYLIMGSEPAIISTMYVDAIDGRIVFQDNEKKYAKGFFDKILENKNELSNANNNSIAKASNIDNHIPNSTLTANQAKTRYSGIQNISTTLVGGNYTLNETRNGHVISTKNYGSQSVGTTEAAVLASNALATDFTDNDNDWTNAGVDEVALEAHFDLEVISDYWKVRHGRNGYDNLNGKITGYIHVGNGQSPYWLKAPLSVSAMYYPDFQVHNYDENNIGPFTTLDASAHEVGHGVTNSADMPKFTTSREPGSLDEGFSDIWGACVENYAILNFPAAAPNKDTWLISEESYEGYRTKGLRNLKKPETKQTPDTYYGNYFIDATITGCPVPNSDANDDCGTHNNSTILGKWFFLITDGETGTNDNGYNYTVAPLGFNVSELIAYNTELLLTPNCDFRSVMNTSINFAKTKYGIASNEAIQVTEAWKAVGLINFTTYDKTNTPIFKDALNNQISFNCIAVGKEGHVWAGTSGKGLFKFNGIKWEKSPTSLDNKVSIFGMSTDLNGGVWMAQAGYSVAGSSATNNSGGVYFFDDTLFTSERYYNTVNNLPSMNSRSIFVDMSVPGSLPKLWVASMSQTNSVSGSSTFTPGGIAKGINFLSDISPLAFSYYRSGIDDNIAGGIGGVQTIGGNNTEVWAYSSSNTTPEIIRYDASGSLLGKYNSSNVPQLFPFFTAKAIYFDVNGNKWIGLGNNGVGLNGIVVKTASGIWFKNSDFTSGLAATTPTTSFPELFPAGTIVNNNAITGDKLGRVYIGTTNGLVIYDASNTLLSKLENYKRYTTDDGLPFNNIKSICVDDSRGGLWLASLDNGIAFWGGPERTITFSTVSSRCPGDNVSYNFNTKGKFYDAPVANKIIIELSDASGSFSSPTLLQEITDYQNTSLRRRVVIPFSLPDGSGYRIRGRSTNPVVIGQPSVPFSVIRNPILAAVGGTPPPPPLFADRECTDGFGWTHYFNTKATPDEQDDIRLLSMKVGKVNTENNFIGHVGDPGFSVKVASTTKAGTNRADQVNNPLITNPYISMNRYWDVTPVQQPTVPVSVRFYYNTQDLADVNGAVPYSTIDHTSLVFTKVLGSSSNSSDPSAGFPGATSIVSYINLNDGSTTPVLAPIPTWIYTNINSNIHQAEFLVDHFSGGTGGSTADNGPIYNSLPLQLLSFSARIAGTGTLLHWKTSSEINTGHFEIERSADGRNFNVLVGTLAAAGNSNAERIYSLTDALPINGKNYYRLKTIDLDGRVSYSNIILIRLGRAEQLITSYPNPIKRGETLQISLQNISAVKIEIINTIGQVVYSNSGRVTGSLGIPISNSFTAGQYLLRIVSENKVDVQKIMVR